MVIAVNFRARSYIRTKRATFCLVHSNLDPKIRPIILKALSMTSDQVAPNIDKGRWARIRGCLLPITINITGYMHTGTMRSVVEAEDRGYQNVRHIQSKHRIPTILAIIIAFMKASF